MKPKQKKRLLSTRWERGARRSRFTAVDALQKGCVDDFLPRIFTYIREKTGEFIFLIRLKIKKIKNCLVNISSSSAPPEPRCSESFFSRATMMCSAFGKKECFGFFRVGQEDRVGFARLKDSWGLNKLSLTIAHKRISSAWDAIVWGKFYWSELECLRGDYFKTSFSYNVIRNKSGMTRDIPIWVLTVLAGNLSLEVSCHHFHCWQLNEDLMMIHVVFKKLQIPGH